jgi:pilus assembly protein CpaB
MARLRGCLWLGAGFAVALVAGFVAFATLSRATAQRGAPSGQEAATPQVSVVVAAQAVEVRALLTAEDLELRELPVDAVPEGAVREVEEAEGQITLVDLYPGEIILAQRLVDPNVVSGDGRLALVVADDEVLMAFPAQDLMSRVGVLKPGDHVDLLFSLSLPVNRGVAALMGREEAEGGASSNEEQFTFNLLQNVTIAAIVGGSTPTGGASTGAPMAILLTVTPQDALVLKYVKDAGGTPDIVLRAPGVEEPFTVEPVDVDYVINRYQIPTQVGQ